MADNMIELVASLNVDDSAKRINEVDIPKLQKKIEGIKIKCELDTEGISSIQSQLANIKINAPQIDLGVGGGSELINNVSHIVDNVEDKIEELRKNLAEKFGVSVDKIVTNTIKNAKGQINSFSFDLTKLSGKVEKFSYNVSRTKQKDKDSGKDYTVTSVKAIGSRDSDKGAIQLLERAAKAANTLERQMINLKAAADDVSAPRPITSQESIDKVAQAYKNAETAVGNLRTANASTFEELNNEAKKAVDELNNVIKAQRNADTAATKLRAKPIEVVKADELSNLDKFVATISNSAIPDVTNLTQRVEELRSELSEVNDKQGLVDYLNKFANVESDFKALVAQAKAVKGALRDLDSFSNNALFQKNKSDPQVSSTLSDIEDIRKEYGRLFAEIGNAKTPEDLQKISNKLTELKPQFDKVVNSANQFKTALKAENIDAGLANRIKRLTADVNAYASANKRAVESTKQMSSGRSFADEWSRITSVMAKGAELTDQELKNLIADFRVFGKEAETVGLKGESAFGKFINSFKIIGTYITAQRVISSITNEIRSAVTELKNIDDILTEISKTSDRTEESLRTLGESSFDVASTYGRTASDYLLGVQEMSRAGFGEKQSEDLAELSLRAQAAGDMTAEMANQYIIATNAAYGLEGNIDALNKVLDSQNYITNRNALNMENLSEATKIAASQASASGVAIDELTAAVGTMVATTQQGGNIAGRALKGILMNIQQVKADAADIGDGGESITTESLSKYETATKALGVSLKEVKNGVWALRDPMQVLKELSEAVRKESEDSVKVANLISSVGGKYRGNQLIALLENWDTYEKMLAEFNSEEAVGSAAEEAAKSANNWAGSINQVKNSWSELVNQFINSDNAITIIQTLNDIIQDLTDSAATGTLRVLANLLTDIVKTLGVITDKVGALPALISAIYAARYLKTGKGIFGTIVDDTNKANKQITIFGSKVSAIKTNLNNIDGKGLNKVSTGIKAIGVQAVWTEIKVAALNIALSMGVSLAVSSLATAISNWANESERAAEEAEELKKRQAELITEGLQNAEVYEKESDELNSILSQYLQLASSSSNVADIKKELSSLQDQLIDKYGEEADGIDLVNNSLEKNIELITKKQRLDAKEWQRDNSENIQAAKDYFDIKDFNDVPKGRTQSLIIDAGDARSEALAEGEKLVDAALGYIKEKYPEIVDDIYLQVTQGMNDDVGLSNFIGGASIEEQKREIDAVAEAYEYALGKYSDTIEYFGNLSSLYSDREEFSKAYNYIRRIQEIQEEEQDWGNLEKDKETFGEYKELLKQLNKLNAQYNDSSLSVAERYGASLELADTVDQLKAIAIQYPVTSETIETALQNIGLSYSDTSATVESAKEVWLKSLDEAQKGVLSDVDKMIAAMKKLTSGEALDSKSAWEIINLDDTGILSDIQLDSNGDYILDIEQIIKLKDIEIQKEIDLRKESIETAKRQKEEIEDRITLRKQLINDLIASGINSGGDQRRLNELRTALESDESAMESLNYTIQNESLYVDELTSKRGNLINSSEMLEAQIKGMQKEVSKLKDEVSKLNTEAEARLKAQEHAVDEIIDKLQDEVDEMEKGKTELEDQLKILEEQKENLEEIVNNYKTAGDAVDKFIDKQVKSLEKEREEIEKGYDKRIEKLKKENEEREDALEREKKLADLTNAKNRKIRTYDKERGWTYDVDKEAVQKAQKELDKYDTDQKIKNLEKEKESAVKKYDDQIESFEKYAEEWKAVIEDIENADNERIAEEILGSDWREKIKSKDTDILGKYKTNYASYTTQLKTLTNNEIKYLNDSIKAKEKEIETKKKQIQVWKDYKDEISKAAKEVKDKLEEYNKYLGDVQISESSTNDTRLRNLETFKTKYSNLIDEISKKNTQIENTEKQITSLTDAMNELNETSNSATTSSTPVMGGIANGITGALTGSSIFEAIIGALQEAFNKLKTSIPHFAKGGSAGFTGLAWMDGTPNSTETVFTAAQSKKLYDYVNNMPEFSQLFSMNPNLLKGKTTNNSSSVSIGQMTVVANNPQEFATQFKQQMSTYLRTKLTESQIY